MLMDHLNKWIRLTRQDISLKRTETKRARHNQAINDAESQLIRVDSILGSIDQDLVAKAAFMCKSFARSLMNFEKQIVALQSRNAPRAELQVYYDRLHEIYSHLDEPDGMEGISTCITLPSIEHQIRQHESTGRWTSAQSCWEVRLQQSPDELEYHLGLLRCLRNLGHYGMHARNSWTLTDPHYHRQFTDTHSRCPGSKSGVGSSPFWLQSGKRAHE